VKSNNLRQLDAFAVPAPTLDPIPDSIIFAQPTFQRAFVLACDASGLDDKQISGPLGIDGGQWSRIKNGGANFPMGQYPEFRELVRNDILLKWVNHRCGLETKPLASEIERRLAETQSRLEEKERELATIMKFIKETRLG
jgi:hypothetical protein